MGVDVVDIGLCGSEEVYFNVFNEGLDGGIMVTASHNPKEYNGLKVVKKKGVPIGLETGLLEIADLADARQFDISGITKGSVELKIDKSVYIEHILSYVKIDKLKKLKVVVNGGNGCAGIIVRELSKRLNMNFVDMFLEPDSSFPNGIPNPMIVENQQVTSQKVIESGADLGVAWDGDFDRCFFFDDKGRFIDGSYVVAFYRSLSLWIIKGLKLCMIRELYGVWRILLKEMEVSPCCAALVTLL